MSRIIFQTRPCQWYPVVEFQNSANTIIASLSIEEDELRFDGDMDKSAEVFFEHFLKPLVDEYIEQRLTVESDRMESK